MSQSSQKSTEQSRNHWHFSFPKLGFESRKPQVEKSATDLSRSTSNPQDHSSSPTLSPSQKIAESFSSLNVKDDLEVERDSVLAELKEISKAISSFSERVKNGFPVEYLKAKIDSHLVNSIHRDDVLLVSSANVMKEYNRNFGEFIDIAIASSIFSSLFQTVLKPFKFGISSQKLNFIEELYNRIKSSETQSDATLWRKFTYKSLISSDPTIVSDQSLAEAAAKPLIRSIDVLLSGTFKNIECEAAQFEEDLEFIALLALNWKTRISTSTDLKLDYEAITIPLEEDFISDEVMEKVLTEKGTILGGFGYGCRSVRYIEDGKGGFKKVSSVIEWPQLLWEKDLES